MGLKACSSLGSIGTPRPPNATLKAPPTRRPQKHSVCGSRGGWIHQLTRCPNEQCREALWPAPWALGLRLEILSTEALLLRVPHCGSGAVSGILLPQGRGCLSLKSRTKLVPEMRGTAWESGLQPLPQTSPHSLSS